LHPNSKNNGYKIMAVYTSLSDEQWQQICHRLGYETITYEREERGTNDSKYVVTLGREGHPPVTAMLNIMETPDVHANGKPAEQSRCLPHLLEHIRGQLPLYGADGEKVEMGVPTPLLFDDSHPCLELEFPSQGGEASVNKVVYVVPFVQGHAPEHYDNHPIDEATARKLGAAHAGWLKAAEGYPFACSMEPSFPVERWESLLPVLEQPETVEKLTQHLRRLHASVGADEAQWQEVAEEGIHALKDAVRYISSHWEERTARLPDVIINGDPFPDNSIINEEGTVIVVDNGTAGYYKNTDLAMGLNAAAMGRQGRLDHRIAASYLEAYQKVRPISQEEAETLEFMGQVSAIRWALSRLMLIANTPEGAIVNARSPLPLIEQYQFWHEMEAQGRHLVNELLPQEHASGLDEREIPSPGSLGLRARMAGASSSGRAYG
jgi:Ser/Thr protein kinase RdoA (MazF antagonist)